MIAHINIGSNLGHRADFIARAVSLLGRQVGRVLRISTPVRSGAWGFESDNEFLNVGVNVETELTPAEIVKRLLDIERTIDPNGQHRDSEGNYADRCIDLDLICLGGMIVCEPGVILPHPRMHLRQFVLAPMTEILPGWLHPQFGLTVEKIFENLRNKTRGADV